MAAAYWLFKTEPETFSWEMLKARGKGGEPWDGVRNFQARKNMLDMKVGDLGFFYHTGEAKEIVDILKVSALAHQDPKDKTGVWKCVDVVAVAPMPKPVTLAAVKQNPKLATMVLAKNARLSMQPVSPAEWREVCRLGGLDARKLSVEVGQRLDPGNIAAVQSFIRANTRLLAPPLVPEIKLHLAEESLPIWQKTEDELGEMNVPPPYWAFAWAGGQALARYLLDAPSHVAGQRVVDLGSGSGLSAIAAKMAGARSVLAADIDAMALAAIGLNAAANGVAIETTSDDLLNGAPIAAEVILVGDLFYERALADRVLAGIEGMAARGTPILVGDPQRNYFPKNRFVAVAEYRVPVTRELEDAEIKTTAVWRFIAS